MPEPSPQRCALSKESSLFPFRHEIAHPGVPRTAADRRHSLVDGEEGDQGTDCSRSREQRRERGVKKEAAADARGPHADCASRPNALNHDHRWHLQQLHKERHRSQQADRGVASAKLDRESDEKDTCRQGSHRLAGERILKNKPKRAWSAPVPFDTTGALADSTALRPLSRSGEPAAGISSPSFLTLRRRLESRKVNPRSAKTSHRLAGTRLSQIKAACSRPP